METLAVPQYRRTQCAIAALGNKNLLFDAPPELASQLLREHIRAMDYLILTHAHPDHCAGLGDLEICTRFHRRDVLPAVMSRESLTQIEGGSESVNDWRDTTLVARMDSSGSAGLSLNSVSAPTLYPRESGEINMSLGYYGCRH